MTTVQRLQRMEKKLDFLIEQQSKPTWVKVSFVRQITGWNKEKMRQARELGLIEWKKDEFGFFYNVTSLSPAFFIRNHHAK